MKKIILSIVVYMLCFYATAYSTTYYVTPSGSSSNSGSSFSSPMNLTTALNAANAGDVVMLQGGTYTIPYTSGEKNRLVLSKSGSSGNYITVSSYNNSVATLDFSFPVMEWVQDSYGLYVTGSYWYFKGLKITRAGYQGTYVTGGYNTFENCIFYDNRNTGLEINKGGHHTTVINCDAYFNYDPKKGGSMADGFGPKQTQGAGNKFIGCRSWYNSDDGYDCYDSPEIVTFENCWAFDNGIDVWQYSGALSFAGNGNGFKVGGNYELANNKLTNCVSFGHPNKGFDQNNNTGGLTLYNCTAYSNGTNFGLGGDLASGEKHILKNNISLNGTVTISTATQSNNTWNSGFSVSSSDFQSLDLNLATASRNSDGTLPETSLFRLKSSSSLINAGVNVGLDYSGSAPDIGAFEYQETTTTYYTLTTNVSGSGSISPSGGSYVSGTNVSLTATPASGWQFDSWSGVDNSSGNTASVTMNSNRTVFAAFTEIPINGETVTIQENETGFCGVDGTLDNNNSGYTGDGFANTDNSSGSGIDYKINVGTSGTYTLEIRYAATSDRPAKLIQNGSTVASNIGLPSTGSWTTWSTITTNINLSEGVSDLRLEATVSDGLPNIDYLKISGENISAADCNGTQPVTYTLTTYVNGSGSVSPTGGTYDQGTSVTLTATPEDGWQFDSWSGDVSGTNTSITVTMNSNITATASFSQTATGSISLAASAGDGQVSLSWSSANISSGFEVYRDTDSDPSGRIRISTVANTVTSYTDLDLSNGTSYYYWIKSTDVSGNEVNSNVASATPQGNNTITTIQIQENETGFCSVDGTIDNNNSGFTGDGFANTANASGNGIDWGVSFGASDSYTFVFRYASSSDRPANLIINGTTVASNINFPSSGSWTTWSTISTSENVSAGIYSVRLEATGTSGLPNIDYMEITGINPIASDCSSLKSQDNVLSLQGTEKFSGINVYPNPSNGIVSIVFNLDTPQRLSLKLFDMTGRMIDLVSENQYNSGENVINYNNSELKAGTYILTMQNNTVIENIKLIIE